MGVLAAGLGSWYYFTGRPEWQVMIFTSLAFMQVFQALAARRESFFKIEWMSNPMLVGMSALVVLLQLMVLYVPAFTEFFELLPLKWYDLSLVILSGLVVFAVMELGKRKENGK